MWKAGQCVTIDHTKFRVKRMTKEDIKRFLAIYFDASYVGEQMPDVDGAQFLQLEYDGNYEGGQ